MKQFLNRAAALLLCLALSCSLLPVTGLAASHPFQDVSSSHWANSAVEYVYDNNLMNGTGTRTFAPGGTLTRAMFVTILGRMDGVNTASYPGTSFSDVPAGQWYSPYVAWASSQGVVTGTGNGQFSPNNPVTREQMAAMIARYVDASGVSLPDAGNPVSSFKDTASVSGWARDGLELMRRTGILSGYADGTFGPKKTATRAEAATIFMRLDTTSEDFDGVEKVEQALADYDIILDELDKIETPYCNEDGYVTKEDAQTLLTVVSEYANNAVKQGKLTDYAYVNGDSCVYMQLDGWLGFLYAPPILESLSGNTENIKIFTIEPFAFELGSHVGNLLNGLKGVDEAAELIVDSLGAPFTFDGNIDNADVVLETFSEIPPNSIVIWNGHGAYNEKFGSILSLGAPGKYNPKQIYSYERLYKDGALLLIGNHCCVTPIYFERYASTTAFEGSLVYLNACSSVKDSRLAQSLWDCGARGIVGNSDTIWTPYATKMAYSFFEGLVTNENRTISQALSYAKEKHGSYDWNYGAEVLACYRDDFTLLDMPPKKSSDGSIITGKVVSSETNQPLSGVRVCLNCIFGAGGEDIGAVCTTGADGTFTLEIPNAATYVTGIHFEKDGYNDYLYPLASAGTSSLDVGTIKLTPKSSDSDNKISQYDMFLSFGAYQDYTENWWCTPSEYALLDIDQDGEEELIIQGKDGLGFYNFAVFTYDNAQRKVVALPVQSGDEFDGQFYTYGGLFYSEKNKALETTPTQPSPSMGGSVYYYGKTGQTLTLAFSLNWGPELGYIKNTPGVGRVSITEQEKDACLQESTEINFRSLPKVSDPFP